MLPLRKKAPAASWLLQLRGRPKDCCARPTNQAMIMPPKAHSKSTAASTKTYTKEKSADFVPIVSANAATPSVSGCPILVSKSDNPINRSPDPPGGSGLRKASAITITTARIPAPAPI